MCFRPPEAGLGESVCPGCYTVTMPDNEGKCPECGASMGATAPGAASPSAPSSPGAPKPPGAPTPPKAPSAPPPKAPGV